MRHLAPSTVRLRWAIPLAISTGVLYVAAFPGIGWWPLAFIALSPLLFSLPGRSPMAGAALGLLSGSVTTFIGFFWLLDTFRIHGGFSTPLGLLLLLALSVAQAGRRALFAALVCALSRKGWPWLASVSVAFVTSETSYPLLFPWFLGASLHAVPPMIQTADVGGPVLVGLPLALTAAVAARAIAPAPIRPRMRTSLIALGAAVALPLSYGLLVVPFIDHSIHDAPSLRIGLVQGNIPMPPVSAETLHERFRAQVRRTRQLKDQGAELVVWPESAFILTLPEDAPDEAIGRTEAGALGVPLVVGALLVGDGPSPPTYNTALMLDAHGKARGRYDKQRLLPFGEYLPFGDRFPFLYRLSPASGRISPGPRSGPIPFEDKRIAVLICYEDVLPGFVSDAVRKDHPHLLLNLTNDAWFGASREPEIHLALAKFRAIEHRRYLARATNTGDSAVVDPMGRVVAQAPARMEASLLAEVRWMHGWTLYGWWGDTPWYAVTLLALGALFIPGLAKQRARAHPKS